MRTKMNTIECVKKPQEVNVEELKDRKNTDYF